MWSATDIFDHERHQQRLEGQGIGNPCVVCHADADGGRRRETAASCTIEGCHTGKQALNRPGATIQPQDPERARNAIGYVDALHKLCISCHRERGPEVGRKDLDQCATCHSGRAAGLQGAWES
jgi:hypothetical protein